MDKTTNQRACCFTGHRPGKLPFDEIHPNCIRLKERLKNEIASKIKNGCTSFITGMAMGADIWCAEFVLELKTLFPEKGIRLTAVLPYENQAGAYPASYMKRYAAILKRVDDTVTISRKYAPGCMQKRNRAMVDSADCVIAVYGGAQGGTKTTIAYARKKGLDIVLLNPRGAREHILPKLHFNI